MKENRYGYLDGAKSSDYRYTTCCSIADLRHLVPYAFQVDDVPEITADVHIVSRHEHAVSELVAATAIDLSVEYIAGHLTFVNEEILVPVQWLGTCSVAVANMDQYNFPFSCPAGFSTFSCEIRESCVALHPEGNQLNDASYGHYSCACETGEC